MDLSSTIENGSPSNFLWSPVSAHQAFSQVLLGSKESTQAELETLLGIKSADTAQYRSLNSGIKRGNSTLKVGNLMALAKGFKVTPSYSNSLQSRFGSQLLELDFANQPDASINEINNFVSSATEGKIEEILSSDQVDSLTRLVLVNAVYFKALWKMEFVESQSFETTFRGSRGDTRTTFMNRKMKVRVLDLGKYEMLELPYQDRDKSFLIVLPKDGESTDNIVENIKNTDFNRIRREPAKDTVVTIPKFSVEHRTNLKDMLRKLGVTSLFQPSANLKGISPENLSVSDAVQDAVIEVGEEGTEAAAATAIIIGLRTAQRTRQFFADRPFLFMVYDFGSQVPIFMGKLVDPAAAKVSVRSGVVPKSITTERTGLAQADATTANSQNCERYLSDYPNARENVNLCEQALGSKLLDWLRKFRTVCESSQNLLDNFQKNNCRSAWCESSKNRISIWTSMFSRRCDETTKQDKDAVFCRQTANKMSAYKSLGCTPI